MTQSCEATERRWRKLGLPDDTEDSGSPLKRARLFEGVQVRAVELDAGRPKGKVYVSDQPTVIT